MKPVKAGPKRLKLQIQADSNAAYGSASAGPNWQTVDTVRASVDGLSGVKLFTAQQVQPDATHEVRLRYWPGLTPYHRFLLEGRILNIVHLADTEERHREHVCLCKETQPGVIGG